MFFFTLLSFLQKWFLGEPAEISLPPTGKILLLLLLFSLFIHTMQGCLETVHVNCFNVLLLVSEGYLPSVCFLRLCQRIIEI